MNSYNILPPNQKAIDQQFSFLMEQISSENYQDLDVNPLTCDKTLLSHLALSYGIDISNLDEQEARRYIKNAKNIKRYEGTRLAVDEASKVVFENSTIKEWYENDLEVGLFDIEVQVSNDVSKIYTPAKFDKSKEIIKKAKNVRSHQNSFIVEVPTLNHLINLDSSNIIYIDVDTQLEFNQINQINTNGALQLWI